MREHRFQIPLPGGKLKKVEILASFKRCCYLRRHLVRWGNFLGAWLLVGISLLGSNAQEKVDPSLNAELSQELRELYQAYQAVHGEKAIEKLVQLDARLRHLEPKLEGQRQLGIDEYPPCWRSDYSQMGLFFGYNGDLRYSGKLLVDAHQINPNSPFRKYTLFSEIFGDNRYTLGVMPNIKAAFQYEREFPAGPFIQQTDIVIADFFKDLYMVLRDRTPDYKYDCFKPYIEKRPIPEQLGRAKRIALKYYVRVLKREPTNELAFRFHAELTDGSINSWSYCAD